MSIIPEDWERESQKDAIYLQEELKLIEQTILSMIAEEKKEAKISVIPPQQEKPSDENCKSEILPF